MPRSPRLLGDLAVLVDNSLVTVRRDQPGGTRYGQLVPLREYATVLLGSERDAALDRLVDYYAVVAPGLGRELEFGRQAEKALNADHNNLLAAMRWSLDHHRIDAMAAVLEHLWLYWFNGDLARSAAEWITEASDHGESRRLAWLRGFFGFQVGEAGAADDLRSAIEQLRPDEDEYWLAIARAFLGMITEPEEGQALLAAASAVVDSDEYGLSRFAVGMFVSVNAVARGDMTAALAMRRRLLELAPTLGHEMMVAYAHQNLAAALIAMGDLESARQHNRIALDVMVAEQTIEGIASVADVEAVLDYAAGHRHRAICILSSAEQRYSTVRTSRWPEAESLVQSLLARAAEEMGREGFARAMAQGASTSLDDPVALLETPPA